MRITAAIIAAAFAATPLAHAQTPADTQDAVVAKAGLEAVGGK